MQLGQISNQFLVQIEEIISLVSGHLSEENRSEILESELASLIKKGTGKTVASVAIYSDAMRMVLAMAAADGKVDSDEVEAILPFVLTVADKFKAMGKKYACFEQTIEGADLDQNIAFAFAFLDQYNDDAGSFGAACQSTRRSGLRLVRNIHQKLGDSRPLELLQDSFYKTAHAIATLDGIEESEQAMLDELKVVLGLSDSMASEQAMQTTVIKPDSTQPEEGMRLTVEIAQKFIRNEIDDLREYTSIDDDAAEDLSAYEGQLSLDGLTSLSDNAARSLRKCRGEWLGFDGLEQISDTAAEWLSKYKGLLSLCALTSISESAAESLSKLKGDLSLQDLTSLSDSVAKSLSNARSVSICSSGSPKMSTLAGAYLGTNYFLDTQDWGLDVKLSDEASRGVMWVREGKWICEDESIEDIDALTSTDAAILAATYRYLNLDGVESLADDAALELSKHQGSLSLSNLRTISETGARYLAKHCGPLILNLEIFPDSISTILAPSQDPVLDERQSFPDIPTSASEDEDEDDQEVEDDDEEK